MSRRVILRQLLIFVAALGVALAVTGEDPPASPTISKKLELLAERGAVEVVFVGSSRTHFNFMPVAFDQELSRLGWETESFNLGILGGGGHEIDYVIARYLRDRPGLKLLLIEFPTFEYQILEPDERTFHKIYWHDLRRTLDAVETSLAGPIPVGLRGVEAREHVEHHVMRTCGLWSSRRGAPPACGGDGFQPWDHPSRQGMEAPPGPAFLKGTEYVVNRRVIRRQQAALSERGIEAVYVIPPGTPNLEPLMEMAEAGEIQLLRLNEPAEHPELFRPDTNAGYLLSAGARVYSELLARKLVERGAGSRFVTGKPTPDAGTADPAGRRTH